MKLNSRLAYHIISLAALLLTGCNDNGGGDGKPNPEPPPPGRYKASLSFRSEILNREIRYSLLLPTDYSTREEQYPTVYLLHGYGDNETSWKSGGSIESTVQTLENEGSIASMIYVMPQANNTYYVNNHTGNYDYMRMFTQELVPLIDKTLRTKAEARYRAVVGYSMGGYGAFILPYKNPGLFSISVPLSMSWRNRSQYASEPQSGWNNQFGDIFGGSGRAGSDRFTDYYLEHDPFELFTKPQTEAQKSLSFFIDSGDDEQQITLAMADLHTLMRDNEIQHQMRVRNGAHEWSYWRGAMTEALPYIHTVMNGGQHPEIAPLLPPTVLYTGDVRTIQIEGAEVEITLPKGYTQDKESHLLYLAYDKYADHKKELKEVRDLLAQTQEQRSFIMVSFDASAQKLPTIQQLDTYMRANYTLCPTAEHHAILANKTGGLWAMADTTKSIGVFLIDAQIPEPLPESLGGSFYCITLGDMGVNYAKASELYMTLRDKEIPHQYRIYNGDDGFNSFLVGLAATRYHLDLKLNLK